MFPKTGSRTGIHLSQKGICENRIIFVCSIYFKGYSFQFQGIYNQFINFSLKNQMNTDAKTKKTANGGPTSKVETALTLYQPDQLPKAKAIFIKKDALPLDKHILDHFDTNVVLLDRSLNVRIMNKAAEKMYGISQNEAQGKAYTTIKTNALHQDFAQNLQAVVETQSTFNLREVQHLGPSNLAKYLDYSYIPIIGKDGQVEGVLSFGKEVPEQVNGEFLAQETQSKLAALFQQINIKNEEILQLRNRLQERYQFGNIIGQNRRMQSIYQLIEKIAPTDATVMIYGETGVGKELIANAIHFGSPRKDGPMISINCAALTETLLESELFGHEKGSFTGAIREKKGKFELASKGTLFLDELGEMSLSTQVKLLRVLQEKQIQRVGGEKDISVDIRIVAATHRNLSELIKTGQFRQDLYYRLNVVKIDLPPLRERFDDIPLLVQYFISKFNKKYHRHVRGISPPALRKLIQYPWPGNIRELESVIEKAFILEEGNEIEIVELDQPELTPTKKHYPNAPCKMLTEEQPPPSFSEFTSRQDQQERDYMLAVFEKFHGSINEVAAHTGLNRRTILNKMKKHRIEKKDFK